MRPRCEPAAAGWLLELFCSSAEHESVIGDLVEQYQLGRGRFWYWRQVLAIVFFGLYRKAARRSPVPSSRISPPRVFALILVVASLSAVLASDISGLGGLLGTLAIFAIGLMVGLGWPLSERGFSSIGTSATRPISRHWN